MTHPIVRHAKRILNMPRYVIPVAAVVAIAIGISIYLSSSTSKNYATTAVVDGNVNSSLSVSGTVKAATQTSLAFPQGGRVASVSIKAGDSVSTGQTLAALDSSQAEGAVQSAEGAYESAQASYALLQTGASASDISVAQTAYTSAVSETAVAVKNAYQKLLSDDLTAENTNNLSQSGVAPIISGTYSGNTQGTITLNVYGQGSGSYWSASGLIVATGTINSQVPQPIGTSGLDIVFPAGSTPGTSMWTINIPNTAGENYTADNAAYQMALQNQTDQVAEAQAALTKVEAAPQTDAVAEAQAQVASAEGALETAKATLANDFITAPMDGTITSVDDSLTPGGIVAPNTPLIGIMSNGAFQIESYISEANLALVHQGQDVSIVTDAYGPSVVFAGTIMEIDPAATTEANGQVGYKVTFQFSNSDPRIKPGLSANVTIPGETKTDVLVVPSTAIFAQNGASFVLVKNGKTVEQRAVTVGLAGSDTVEIVSGLTEGEQVVTLGAN